MHITRQHHQLAVGFAHDVHQAVFLLRLGGGGHLQMDVAQAVRLDQRLQVRVVGDHAGDVHLELAAAVAVQQIDQAVVELGHHDEHAGPPVAVGNGPLHVLALRHFLELLAQAVDGRCACRVAIKRHAGEKAAGQHIVKLLHVGDVALARGQKARHRCHRAHAAGAACFEDVVGFAFERNIHVVSALCWSDKVGDVASRPGCFSQFR